MPYRGKFDYEKRKRERFIYALFDASNQRPTKMTRPCCYVGEAYDPYKRFWQHIKLQQEEIFKLKSEWIKKLKSDGREPDFAILESIISTYTSGDSLTAEKAWLWAAYLDGYQLLLPKYERFNPDNISNLSPNDKELIEQRRPFNRFLEAGKIQTTPKQKLTDLTPSFGYTLVTNSGAFICSKSREERNKKMCVFRETTDDWEIADNQGQYKEHREILSARKRMGKPLDLARWIAKPIIRNSDNWVDLKNELWEWRWTIRRLPRGAVLHDGKSKVRLSKIAPECSLDALEIRFGEEFVDNFKKYSGKH